MTRVQRKAVDVSDRLDHTGELIRLGGSISGGRKREHEENHDRDAGEHACHVCVLSFWQVAPGPGSYPPSPDQ